MPKLDLRPGGLGAGEAQRVLEALAIETEQMGARRRGAEGADGSGGVEAGGVVAGVDDRAQAALDLDAGHDRGEQARAGSAARLGQGERRRDHRHRGVPAHRGVGVVEVEGVGRGAVDQRGEQRRGPLRLGAEQRRLAALTAGRELLAQDDGERLARARERGAQPVEETVLGGGDRVGRQRRERCRSGRARRARR